MFLTRGSSLCSRTAGSGALGAVATVLGEPPKPSGLLGCSPELTALGGLWRAWRGCTAGEQRLPQRLCTSLRISHGIPITHRSRLLVGWGAGVPPCCPMDRLCLCGDLPGAALPGSAQVAAAAGTGTGHYKDRSGTGCGRRCRDELGVSAPLPQAWSEGAGLCHAGISPCPGGFTGSKGALPAACAGVGSLAPTQPPAAVRAHCRWDMWGCPRPAATGRGEAHTLPGWRRKER